MPLTRYAAVTMYDAPEPFATMDEDKNGSYIHAGELRAALDKMLAEACDPGEKDALNSVIKLVGEA